MKKIDGKLDRIRSFDSRDSRPELLGFPTRDELSLQPACLGACAAYYTYGRHLERVEPDRKITTIRSAGAA